MSTSAPGARDEAAFERLVYAFRNLGYGALTTSNNGLTSAVSYSPGMTNTVGWASHRHTGPNGLGFLHADGRVGHPERLGNLVVPSGTQLDGRFQELTSRIEELERRLDLLGGVIRTGDKVIEEFANLPKRHF